VRTTTEETALIKLELLIVGAHNGSVLKKAILDHASRGPVLLLEPVPHLFSELSLEYGNVRNVYLEQKCVAEKSGKVSFFAPSSGANSVARWGDQLGSMNPDHAVLHNPEFAKHVTHIEVGSVTFEDIIKKYNIASIETLLTDTEGYDATLIPMFPFHLMFPNTIIFEFKHSDGVFNIGKKLGTLLIFLDTLGYNIKIHDMENAIASRRRTPTHRPGRLYFLDGHRLLSLYRRIVLLWVMSLVKIL
jgi:FkbM family methyltransferase